MRRIACWVWIALALAACGQGEEAGEAAPEGAGGEAIQTPAYVQNEWSTGPLSASADLSKATGEPTVPVLQLVRPEMLETTDRVMIEFQGAAIPAYSAEYVTGPIEECGSGNRITPTGNAWISLRFEPGQAHTEAGEPTLSGKEIALDGTNVKKAYVTCDFEGVVTLVFALESQKPFRISRLEGPTRFMLDVQH